MHHPLTPMDPRPSPPIFRRYKWSDLTPPERDAVSDALGIVGMRAGVGMGVVATGAAALGAARRGKPPLPPGTKYGSLGFFLFLGAYGGFLSAGALCAERVLSVPNSPLADDLRQTLGDWQARAPVDKIVQAAASGGGAAGEDGKTAG